MSREIIPPHVSYVKKTDIEAHDWLVRHNKRLIVVQAVERLQKALLEIRTRANRADRPESLRQLPTAVVMRWEESEAPDHWNGPCTRYTLFVDGLTGSEPCLRCQGKGLLL